MSAAVDGPVCDCHLHVYDGRWPLAPTATFVPPQAPAAAYRSVQQALGLQRAIVVQPTGYGFDNGCTLDAIAQLGPGARGVAVVPASVGEAEIEHLHQAGVRGVRFMMLSGGVLPWAALEPLAARIAPWGWHIDLQLDGHDLPQHLPQLLALPCRLVIDHLGKFLRPVLPDSPGLLALEQLLDAGRCWIKLSAPYESSRRGPPDYDDVAPLAARLAQRFPERGLWASNWPHPNVQPRPAEQALLDWALQAIGAARQRVLVDNPAELYGFSAAAEPPYRA
ncbi:MAG: amidohydrolase family protein [Rubrivivax sp.]